MDLYEQYDENLSQNIFFKKLQAEHKIILETAPLENWIVCVPRSGTVDEQTLENPTFLLAHILIPNDELPESHFTNLSGTEIKLDTKKLIAANFESLVLFEELFYTKGLMKYKVWCIESPLIETEKSSMPTGLFVVRDLKDAIELIWNETNSKVIFRKIDNVCKQFIRSQRNSKKKTVELDKIKHSTKMVYNHCLQNMLFNKRLKEKCRLDSNFYKILKIALETYIMSVLYEYVFDAIAVSTLEQGEHFNKIIRNLSDVQLPYFNVDQKYMDVVACVRVELLKIEESTTAIEKLGCLRHSVIATSRKNHKSLCVDHLIPIIAFVIVKSGLTHWTATLTFLKDFIFNELTDISEKGADGFLVTTLEAAITYITNLSDEHNNLLSDHKILPPPCQSKFTSKGEFMTYLFAQIKCCNEAEVLRLFKGGKDVEILIDSGQTNGNHVSCSTKTASKNMCHPLCDCEKCSTFIEDNTISINMQNINGITAIHAASMYGLPKMINLLLALEADLTICDENNWTALHYSAARGHQSALLLLLHAGIEINAVTNELYTALHLSCLNGHLGCVKALLYYSDHMKVFIEKNSQTKMGDTALHLAAKWGFTEVIETLVEYGVKVDYANRSGYTATDLAHNSFVTELLQNVFVIIDYTDSCEASPSSESPSSSSANPIEPFRGCIPDDILTEQQKRASCDKIIKAILSRDTKLAYYFLGHCDDDTPEDLFDTKTEPCHPLCNCTKCSNPKQQTDSNSNINEDMIIDLNQYNSDGLAMIHAAAKIGDASLVQYLFDRGASVNRKTKNTNQTILHLAVLSQNLQTIEFCLNHASENNLNAHDIDDNTALHLAVQSGNVKIVELILLHEPNLHKVNAKGQTPMDIAKSGLMFTIIKLLDLADTGAEESSL